jgi:Tfp pilus assembly protein PilV
MAKKAFSLLEVTVSIFIMGLTVVALLNLLTWSNSNYKEFTTSWKERNCLTEARIWLRNQIINNNENNLNLKSLNNNVKCPSGFGYNHLEIKKHDVNTFFIKVSVYEDKNNNGVADSNETTSRLFCFRKRSV